MMILIKIIILSYFFTWLGTWLWIKTLKNKSKQIERIEGPPSHKNKEGTPTMGGVIFVLTIIIFPLIFIKHLAIILPIIFLVLSFTILGLIDDLIIVKFKSNKGISPRIKFLLQLIFSTIFIFLLLIFDKNFLPTSGYLTYFIHNYLWLYLIFAVLVITGTANAVNLSDGLDGLSGGMILPAFIFFAWKALTLNQPEAFLFLIISSSAVLAFLFFNVSPAKVFMGNVGSYALGAILAAVAILLHQELMLLIIGGVFVLETLSVILQIISFKLTGRRIFLMSPLHHHFELLGWSEIKVVRMFWTASLLFMFLGMFINGRH